MDGSTPNAKLGAGLHQTYVLWRQHVSASRVRGEIARYAEVTIFVSEGDVKSRRSLVRQGFRRDHLDDILVLARGRGRGSFAEKSR